MSCATLRLALLLAALVAAAAAAAATTGTAVAAARHPWPMLFGDTHHTNAAVAPLGVSPRRAKVDIVWRRKLKMVGGGGGGRTTGGGGGDYSYGGGYGGGGGGIGSGYGNGGPAATAMTVPMPPAVASNGMVFAQGNETSLHALAGGGDGRLLWTLETDELMGTPTLDSAGERLYVAGFFGHLHAVRVRDGALLWRVFTNSSLYTAPVLTPDGERAVVVTSLGGWLGAFDADSGRELWRRALRGPAVSAPALVHVRNGGAAYRLQTGSFAGEVVAVDERGALAWSGATHNPVDCAVTLTPDEQYAVQADIGGDVYAFDPRDGALRWTTTLGYRTPTPTLVSFDTGGSSGGGGGGGAKKHTVVYYTGRAAMLWGLAHDTGAVLFNNTLAAPLAWSATATADGVLVYATRDGHVNVATESGTLVAREALLPAEPELLVGAVSMDAKGNMYAHVSDNSLLKFRFVDKARA